jgi:PAP2 superfamily
VPSWELASAVFFTYVAIAAVASRRINRGVRLRVLGGAFLGVALDCGALALPSGSFARTWILPPLLLGCAYWTSGGLFVAPMPRAEYLLEQADAALGIDWIAARTPRPFAEALEVAYSSVYAVIPISLFVALGNGLDGERFWSVVLVTDYICFACLPWIQTRPPRAFRLGDPWRSSWRAVNLRLLDASSIQVNTFPSGHAAEAVAAALLTIGATMPVVVAMSLAALAISAGAVLGRYHYALDAFTGWLVAVTVYGIASTSFPVM